MQADMILNVMNSVQTRTPSVRVSFARFVVTVWADLYCLRSAG